VTMKSLDMVHQDSILKQKINILKEKRIMMMDMNIMVEEGDTEVVEAVDGKEAEEEEVEVVMTHHGSTLKNILKLMKTAVIGVDMEGLEEEVEKEEVEVDLENIVLVGVLEK